jgi:predicted enzyme related to lactoylglutathione lyase
MSDYQGKFVWYDLMTSDPKAAEAFYKTVIGWDAKDSGMTDRSYTILSVGPTMVGGLMPIPPRATGAKPVWMGYIGVDDVDATAAQIKAAGGLIHMGPEDIPGIGRFAVMADPQGAVFLIFRGSNQRIPEPVAMGTPGHIGWHELLAGDLETAWPFYAGFFNWTKADAMDMGSMGIYQIFSTGGAPNGGMMTKMPQIPAPFWLYYFNVDDIDAAVKRVTDSGGQLANGPNPVPGGSWIAQCVDPQGATFAIVGPKH